MTTNPRSAVHRLFVSRVISVTGGAAACGGLAPELERLTGLPVRIADPLTRVKVPRNLRGGDTSGSLAVAVGLGIED